jgi:hypothetical protein
MRCKIGIDSKGHIHGIFLIQVFPSATEIQKHTKPKFLFSVQVKPSTK